MTPEPSRDPPIDQLVARALHGLSPAEHDALRRTLDAALGGSASEAQDLFAAAADHLLNPPEDPLPASVRARLLAAADTWLAEEQGQPPPPTEPV